MQRNITEMVSCYPANGLAGWYENSTQRMADERVGEGGAQQASYISPWLKIGHTGKMARYRTWYVHKYYIFNKTALYFLTL